MPPPPPPPRLPVTGNQLPPVSSPSSPRTRTNSPAELPLPDLPPTGSFRASACFCPVASRIWHEQALQEGEKARRLGRCSQERGCWWTNMGRRQESQWAKKGWDALGKQKRCKLEGGGMSQVYDGKPWGTVGLRWMPFMEVGILEGSGLEHPSGVGSGPGEVPTSDQETEEPKTRRILRHPVPPPHSTTHC